MVSVLVGRGAVEMCSRSKKDYTRSCVHFVHYRTFRQPRNLAHELANFVSCELQNFDRKLPDVSVSIVQEICGRFHVSCA